MPTSSEEGGDEPPKSPAPSSGAGDGDAPSGDAAPEKKDLIGSLSADAAAVEAASRRARERREALQAAAQRSQPTNRAESNKKLAQLEVEHALLAKKTAGLEANNRRLQAESEEAMKASEDARAQLQADLDAARVELTEMKEGHAKATREWEEKNGKLTDALKDALEEITKLRKKKDALDEKVSTLEEEVTELSRQATPVSSSESVSVPASGIDDIPAPRTPRSLDDIPAPVKKVKKLRRPKSNKPASPPAKGSDKKSRRKGEHHSRRKVIEQADVDSASSAGEAGDKTEEWASLLDDLSGSNENRTKSTSVRPKLFGAADSLTRPGTISGGRSLRTTGTSKIFNTELGEMIADETFEVPLFLVALCTRLEELTDGSLFLQVQQELLSGKGGTLVDRAALTKLRDNLSSGGNVEAADVSPACQIALLIQWLEELPVSVMTGYRWWLSWVDITDPAYKLRVLAIRLHALSPEQCRTLLYLMHFMKKFSADDDEAENPSDVVRALSPAMLRDDRPVLKRSGSFHEKTWFVVSTQVLNFIMNHLSDVLDPDPPIAGDLSFSIEAEGRWVSAGTVDRLIAMSADDFYLDVDPEYVSILFLTHEYMMTDEELLAHCLALIDRCDPTQEWQLSIRLRVLKNLRKWLRDYSSSLRTPALVATEIEEFFSSFDSVSPAEEQVSQFFLSTAPLLRKMPQESSGTEYKPKEDDSSKFNFLEMEAKDVAIQLTLLDSEVFRAIPGSEFVMKAWENEASSPKYHAMVGRFNDYRNWVLRDLLDKPDSRSSSFAASSSRGATKRAKILSQWIRVAWNCMHLGNFHAAFAIFSTLVSAPIERLARTWKNVSDEDQSKLNDVKTLFDMRGGFADYKKELLSHKNAVVPWIGLIPKDLTPAEEMETNRDAADVFNFGKLRVLHRIISPMLKQQEKVFSFTIEEPVRQWLEALRIEAGSLVLDDNVAYSLSKALEKGR
jgi:RasGEF domain/RasGEF N-terminal motif/RhoGAP domain